MTEACVAILEKGSVPRISDCGANIGLSAMMFKKRFPGLQV